MQWVMNRVTAMWGAAEPNDPFDNDSEDDSDSEGGAFPWWHDNTFSVEKSSPSAAEQDKAKNHDTIATRITNINH